MSERIDIQIISAEEQLEKLKKERDEINSKITDIEINSCFKSTCDNSMERVIAFLSHNQILMERVSIKEHNDYKSKIKEFDAVYVSHHQTWRQDLVKYNEPSTLNEFLQLKEKALNIIKNQTKNTLSNNRDA